MNDKKLSLFDHLDIISRDKRELTEDELTSYSPYMINRFVSMVDHYLPIVAQANQYEMPKDVHHHFFRAFLPKRKQFFKYVNSKKDKQTFEAECLKDYFECGPNDVDEMLELMSEEELEFIISKYRVKEVNQNARTKRKRNSARL